DLPSGGFARPTARTSGLGEATPRLGAVTSPLAVVLVHWNQAEACLRTIDAFRRQDVPVRVIVADNGSEVGELGVLRAEVEGAEDVELVEVGHNSGFGPGANVGLRRWLEDPDGSEWAVLAPHDVD